MIARGKMICSVRFGANRVRDIIAVRFFGFLLRYKEVLWLHKLANEARTSILEGQEGRKLGKIQVKGTEEN